MDSALALQTGENEIHRLKNALEPHGKRGAWDTGNELEHTQREKGSPAYKRAGPLRSLGQTELVRAEPLHPAFFGGH